MDFSFEYAFQVFELTFRISVSQCLLFLVNITLFIFAGKIVSSFDYDKKDTSLKKWGFRFFNMAFLGLQLLNIILTGINNNYQQSLSKVSYSLVTVYISYLIIHISAHFVNSKFGKKKIIDGKEVPLVSYSSRMVNILVFGSFSFLALVTVINIWGYESLLEATGMIGLLLGFIALSSSIWGPDLFHGLMLLNSNTIEDGDIIEVNDEFFIIHKTSFMETALLDIQNNCRSRMRNSTLASLRIDNMTKLAHSHGLRERLVYNSGYPSNSSFDELTRKKMLKDFNQKLDCMFNKAFEESTLNKDIKINKNLPFEILLEETGDYALRYSVSFYISEVKKTRFTHQARSILKTKYLVNEIIFEESINHGIDLSTPILLNQAN